MNLYLILESLEIDNCPSNCIQKCQYIGFSTLFMIWKTLLCQYVTTEDLLHDLSVFYSVLCRVFILKLVVIAGQNFAGCSNSRTTTKRATRWIRRTFNACANAIGTQKPTSMGIKSSVISCSFFFCCKNYVVFIVI